MIQIFRDDLGDWVTLYVDGESKIGNHSITLEQVLKVAGIPYEIRSTDDLLLADDDTKRDEVEKVLGCMPNRIEEVNVHLKEDKRFTV
jgi:hypothetical protein